MKRKNLNSIIRKSFSRDGKLSFSLTMIILVCSILISMFSGLLCVIEEVHRDEAQKKYGKYQFGVMNIEKDDAMDISNMDFFTTCAVFSSEYIELEDSGFYKMCADENFWKISDYKIVNGKEPVSENEVVCDKAFLVQYGYSEEDIGSNIKIENEGYVLTGIIKSAKSGNNGGSVIMPFFKEKAAGDEKYAVMFVTDNRAYKSLIDNLKKYGKYSSYNFFLNSDVQEYTGRDESYSYIGIMKTYNFFRYIIIIPCIILTVSVSIFFGRKISSTCDIYFKYGVNKVKVYGIFLSQIVEKIFLVSAISVSVVYMCVIKYLDDKGLVIEDIAVYTAKNIAKINLIYILISCVFFVGIFCWRIYASEGRFVKKSECTRGDGLLAKKGDNIYMKISIENKNFGVMRNFIIVLMLVATCAMTTGMNYFMRQYLRSNTYTDKYQYFIEMYYDDSTEEIYGNEQYEELYKSVCESEDVKEVLPLYRTFESLRVNVDMLNEHYKNYISETSEYYGYAISNGQSGLDLTAMIVGMDNELAKKYGIDYDVDSLGKDECLFLKYTSAPGGEYGYETGVGKNNKLVFNVPKLGGDIEYNVKKVVENYDVGLLAEYYTQIIVINLDSFKLYERYDYPNTFYINTDGSNGVINRIRYKNDVDVTDFEARRQEAAEYNITIGLSKNILIVLVLVLMSAVVSVTAYIGYLGMKRQAASMYAMGIGTAKIAYIFNGDIQRIYENVFLIGGFASILTSYFVCRVIGKDLYFYKYSIPWSDVAMPLIYIGGSLLLSMIIIYIVICRMDVVGILKNEE